MVIRPKSIATVVVDFISTPDVSSTPTLASVSVSSVVSGEISLTAPTSVVLPTPKPPATRILTAVGHASSGVSLTARSEGAKSIDHRLQYPLAVRLRHRVRPARQDQPLVQQVTEQ